MMNPQEVYESVVAADGLESERAVAIAESGVWREWSHEERARAILCHGVLCMPFDSFHESVEKALGRDVLTHEFADIDKLFAELNGEQAAPSSPLESLNEILARLPEDKRPTVIAVVPDDPGFDPDDPGFDFAVL